jgi:hypothetical protein
LIYNYEKQQPEKAKPLYEILTTLKPSFPWEKPLVAEAENQLINRLK